jgi:hypothetical protein
MIDSISSMRSLLMLLKKRYIASIAQIALHVYVACFNLLLGGRISYYIYRDTIMNKIMRALLYNI